MLHGLYDMHRVNHSVTYSQDGACTNQAVVFLALRRAELGRRHRISGAPMPAKSRGAKTTAAFRTATNTA
jgi:hypothetical protein